MVCPCLFISHIQTQYIRRCWWLSKYTLHKNYLYKSVISLQGAENDLMLSNVLIHYHISSMNNNSSSGGNSYFTRFPINVSTFCITFKLLWRIDFYAPQCNSVYSCLWRQKLVTEICLWIHPDLFVLRCSIYH